MSTKNIIVAIVGLCGSGKSFASEYFVSKGFKKVYFGQITIDEIKNRKLDINPKNENIVRKDIRNKHGMAAYALLSLPKIKSLILYSKILIDGLYSLSEYNLLKKHYPDFITLSLFTTKPIRYERLSKRKIRPLDSYEVDKRDRDEINYLEKAGPIALADYTIVNNSSDLEFRDSLAEFLDYFKI